MQDIKISDTVVYVGANDEILIYSKVSMLFRMVFLITHMSFWMTRLQLWIQWMREKQMSGLQILTK